MNTQSQQLSILARQLLSMRGVGLALSVVGVVLALVLTARSVQSERVEYAPADDLETEWGTVVAVANITMHSRHAGSDRIGFFRAGDGTVWGLPLATPSSDQVVRACAPTELHGAKVTDSLAADVVAILGASDFFSNALDGTSGVHLLVRPMRGALRWERIAGSEYVSSTGKTCRERSQSGRHRDALARYHYFRIAPASTH